jgi:RND superfamily putative drug exporter
MGNFLHRLGSFAYTYKWRVLLSWIIILVVLGFLAATHIKPTSAAISIPGTEAQKALDRVSELFPATGKGSARIVYEAPTGKQITSYNSSITELISTVQEVDGVSSVTNPFSVPDEISQDGTIAYSQVSLAQESGSITATTRSAIATAVSDARASGLTVAMGGDLIDKAPGEILGIGEVAGVVLALVVLVITLGSLISAGMPIATAVIAIAVSMAGLFSLSQLITIGSTTPTLAVMLGLAVGIDYSLFIINKYRTYLLDGYENKLAAAKAISTAGNAVIFAAATVVIALSALTIVNIPFMSTMGLAGAATVAVAAFVAITLVPALLGLAGHKVFWGKTRRKIVEAQAKGPHEVQSVSRTSIWYRWGAMIVKRPVVFLILGVVVMGAIALPARSLTLGLPTDEYAAKSTTQRQAYDLLSKGFGVGFNSPLLVVVEGLPAVNDADKTAVRNSLIAQIDSQFAALPVNTVTTAKKQAVLAQVDAMASSYVKFSQLQAIAQKLSKLDNVKMAGPILGTDDGTKGVVQIIPNTAPADAKTISLITKLRSSDEQKSLGGTMSLAVTGATALQSDINTKLANALPQYLAVVVGLSLILLIVAFRSILVPIKATIGFLLSVLAMFGALVAVYQWGWLGIASAPGPIVSFVPIIAIGVLFGLGMDYEFFLVSSMHEVHLHTKNAKQAVITGFGIGSKVVTAAALIMVSVFAGFITNSDGTVQAIGFGLALGVFLDAFIVRMTIVPTIMTLLGNAAWWLPKWLDKIIPHISIEGEEDTKPTR